MDNPEERRYGLMSIMELLYDQEAYTELDRQAVREEALAEGEAIGEAKGKAKGKAEGEILGTAKTLLALGKTEAEAVGFIVRKYGMDTSEALRVVSKVYESEGSEVKGER